MTTLTQPRNLLRLALAAFLLAVLSHVRADPDLWGHVLFGRDTVAARAIPAMDSYSFTSDRTWINHEWLAECVIYAAYAIGGPAGLVALKVLLLAAMLAAVWTTIPRDVDATWRDLLIVIVVIGTVPQASHVRPQLFSLALFALLLAVLAHASRGWQKPLAVGVIMALWVNMHGGWLVGGGTIAIWTAASLLDADHRRETGTLAATGLIAAAATLLNPYGWHIWKFLYETVGFTRAEIIDWQPVFRMGAPYILLWGSVTAAALLGWRGLRDLRAAAVVFMFMAASFRVNRLIAFFAIAVVMLLGRAIARVLAGSDRRAAPIERPSRAATAISLVVAVVLLAGGITLVARNTRCIPIDASLYPERVVGITMGPDRLRGRIVTWFDWGEYVIWHFAPDAQVSIDGRRETVYSDSVIQDHLRFYFDPSSRRALLDRWQPAYVWLPNHLPVVPALKQDGWTIVYSGSSSMLLAPPGRRAAPLPPIAADEGMRCFPGP